MGTRPQRSAGATVLLPVLFVGLATALAAAGEPPGAPARDVSFATDDGGVVYADLYGDGDTGVVLAHGARFGKASWAPQAQALAAAGFRVLALDFRGYRRSRGPGDDDPFRAPLYLDVLAGVRYLRKAGAQRIFAVGASLGGGAAAHASAAAPGEIERLVLLAPAAYLRPAEITSRTLYIVAEHDATAAGTPRLDAIRAQYERTPDPKELFIVDGSAHAQNLFASDQGERVMAEIIRFLKAE